MGGSLLLLLVALLGWANWEEPELHDFAPTTELAVHQVDGLNAPAQAQALDAHLRALAGVVACSIDPTTHLAVVSYDPAQLSATDIRRALALGGAYAVAAPAPQAADLGPPRPQCPVPASYITALNRLRFTLNARRFFVQGV